MNTNTIAFICPISKPNTEIRRRSDDIMDNILYPIAKSIDYSVVRADFLTGEVIIEDIINMIMEADIVVADLTGFNPNVFYELGVRKAIKGKCICIIKDENLDDLPFDIRHLRAISYEFNSAKSVEVFKQKMEFKIKDLVKKNYSPLITLSPNEIVTLFNATVVKNSVCGKKEHYALANNIVNRKCKRIFLMQRSSSLILGAEQDWDEEKEFIDILTTAINNCSNFFHIVSTEGIKAHIKRKASEFPEFSNYAERLKNCNGKVAIKTSGKNKTKNFFLRNLPKDDSDSYFKLDRQARIMSIEYEDGQVETVIVQNLGADQTCFVIRGDYMKEYFRKCKEYYSTCEPLMWSEVETLYEEYTNIEKSKM